MGKIVYLMGKSSSGKDTIFKALQKEGTVALTTIVPYTTRPIRSGEQEGEAYHFVTEEAYLRLEREGRIVESRVYHTVYGPWRYFTADDGQIDLEGSDAMMIGTLEGYESLCAYYGREAILPIYIELDDGIRLQRALDRERKQEHPKYEEMCRRFLADSEDFSEEKLAAAGIVKRFQNENLEECLKEIEDCIREAGNAVPAAWK